MSEYGLGGPSALRGGTAFFAQRNAQVFLDFCGRVRYNRGWDDRNKYAPMIRHGMEDMTG